MVCVWHRHIIKMPVACGCIWNITSFVCRDFESPLDIRHLAKLQTSVPHRWSLVWRGLSKTGPPRTVADRERSSCGWNMVKHLILAHPNSLLHIPHLSFRNTPFFYSNPNCFTWHAYFKPFPTFHHMFRHFLPALAHFAPVAPVSLAAASSFVRPTRAMTTELVEVAFRSMAGEQKLLQLPQNASVLEDGGIGWCV